MTKADIQRQYDEVIAPHYDLDPLAIVGDSLSRALAQVKHVDYLSSILPPLDVLDVGIGTGTFCERLRRESGRTIHPHGLDISRPMIEIVRVETFEPKLSFQDFQEFMSFAWRGGWLTPFIEQLGLHKAGRLLRTLLNTLVFPVADSHRIVIALARKSQDRS